MVCQEYAVNGRRKVVEEERMKFYLTKTPPQKLSFQLFPGPFSPVLRLFRHCFLHQKRPYGMP
jgi:hypothetical protein